MAAFTPRIASTANSRTGRFTSLIASCCSRGTSQRRSEHACLRSRIAAPSTRHCTVRSRCERASPDDSPVGGPARRLRRQLPFLPLLLAFWALVSASTTLLTFHCCAIDNKVLVTQ